MPLSLSHYLSTTLPAFNKTKDTLSITITRSATAMTSQTQRFASTGLSYENLVRDADSFEIFIPDDPTATSNTTFAIWDCKNCGRLYVDPVANPDCMPTPPATECFISTDVSWTYPTRIIQGYIHGYIPGGTCQYQRLELFPSWSPSELQILHLSDIWNGICKSTSCSKVVEHRRFQCGNLVDTFREATAERNVTETGKGVGPVVMMMGTSLAFWGALVVAASVL